MVSIEGPRPGIDPGTLSPQGEHANYYTNRDRQKPNILAIQI